MNKTTAEFTPQHLSLWIDTVNYEGPSFENYYVAYWRPFRCTPMERSNYHYIHEHLEDSGAPSDQLINAAFTDEVLKRRYYLLIHKDSFKTLKMADMFMERVKRKGSLDPEYEEKLTAEHLRRTWRNGTIRHKVAWCKEAGISIFTARNEELDEVVTGYDDLVTLLLEIAP